MYMQSGSNDVASDAEVLARLTSGRFTCRAYQTTPVPNDVIESIVEIARKTASWCNVQPWHLLITSAETTQSFRDALVEHATHASGIDSDIPFPEEYRGDFAERRREAGYRLYEALGIGRSDKDRRVAQGFENFRMFGAPHVAIVTIPAELGPYAGVDCGAFIGSFLLAAHAHGVATTPQGALLSTQGLFDRTSGSVTIEKWCVVSRSATQSPIIPSTVSGRAASRSMK